LKKRDIFAVMGDDMPEAPWPPYRVGNSDYIHALGVIASVYNLLEFRFRSLFAIYTRLPSEPAYKLFGKLSNEMRLELIHGAIPFSSHPEPIKQDVNHFLTGFKICADNRNILMHSTVVYVFGPGDTPCPELSPPGQQPQGVSFQKSPKGDPFRINTYSVSLPEIRAFADAIHDLEVYGDKLYWHILKTYEPKRYRAWGFPKTARFPLPSRPTLPKRLKMSKRPRFHIERAD
jgi:hypothetical protein